MQPRRCIAFLALAVPLASPGADVTWPDVAPLLDARCVVCHQGPAAPLGLRLDSLEGLRAGSRNGPVAAAGDPEGSELIRRLKGTSLPRMPMTGPPFLDAAEIALFEQWIAAGMPPGEGADAPADAAPPAAPGDGPVTWDQVAPIFATRCARCHTDDGLMGGPPEGYRLTSWAAAVAAGDRARVVPGHPAASELLRRIRGQARPRMPFDGPPYLSGSEIELIARWIAEGARNSLGGAAPVPAGAKVRLHGTLEAGGRLDGLELAITPDTRIDDGPRAGDYVQVRGRLAPDGRVVVERLRERD
jgi:mono/diheme cytochrome c family protein